MTLCDSVIVKTILLRKSIVLQTHVVELRHSQGLLELQVRLCHRRKVPHLSELVLHECAAQQAGVGLSQVVVLHEPKSTLCRPLHHFTLL